MSALSFDTWISLAVLVSTLGALYVALRREFRSEIRGLRTELKGDIADAREETRALRTELKEDINDLRTELRSDINDLRTELKEDIHRLDDRVYALAVGLRPQIEQVDPASGQ